MERLGKLITFDWWLLYKNKIIGGHPAYVFIDMVMKH